MSYLSETAEAGPVDVIALGQRVMQQGGPGSWGQLWGVLKLWVRRRGFKAEEYYTYGLWRKDLDPAFLRQFQTAGEVMPFNVALRMPGRGHPGRVVVDKLATEAVLVAAGLPATRTLAVVGPVADFPGLEPPPRHLLNAPEIADWLLSKAPLPLFGKPRADSYARGSCAIVGRDAAAGSLRFLNGREVPAAALAEEILADWPEGYLFQPFYAAHPGLAAHAGAAMASLRIVTLRLPEGIAPWYAVLRLPAPKAMHDGDAKGRRIWALVDLETGRVARLADLRDPMAQPLTHAADPSTPLLGADLPGFAAALAACCAAHRHFEGHGMLGWDVFLTPDGPLLNEANQNPGHLYQVAAGRGLRNPDLEPAYQRALALARAANQADGEVPRF